MSLCRGSLVSRLLLSLGGRGLGMRLPRIQLTWKEHFPVERILKMRLQCIYSSALHRVVLRRESLGTGWKFSLMRIPSMSFYLSHCRGTYCPSILITSWESSSRVSNMIVTRWVVHPSHSWLPEVKVHVLCVPQILYVPVAYEIREGRSVHTSVYVCVNGL